MGVISLKQLGSQCPEGFSNWISNITAAIPFTHTPLHKRLGTSESLPIVPNYWWGLKNDIRGVSDGGFALVMLGESQMTHYHYY